MSDGFYLMRTEGLWGPPPKRGDLMQTAVGTKRERTWFIWYTRRNIHVEREWRVMRVRWWEIDAPVRVMLWKSAERAGGQTVWYQNPKSKPKRSIQDIL